ncbi:hypothetical protein J7J23_02545 [bacterium]|nr:hypothetical protein [bacterium]
MSLTKRQAIILESVCQEYIEKVTPVSSSLLKQRFNIDCSTATIRNEFVNLERKHFLSHPYISSGRIPTERAYRFFVDKIFQENDFLSLKGKLLDGLVFELKKTKNLLSLSRVLTKYVSYLTSNLALSYIPGKEIIWKDGWDLLVEEPEFQDILYWKEFLSSLSEFEENIQNFINELENIKVYIGKETPLKRKEMSIVIGKAQLSGNEDIIIAILGPKRMDFRKNISLVNFLRSISDKITS